MEINFWYTLALGLCFFIGMVLLRTFDPTIDNFIIDKCPDWVFKLDLYIVMFSALLLIGSMIWFPLCMYFGMEAAAGHMWGLIMI